MPENLAPLWVPEHDYLPPEDRSVIRALRASPGIVDHGNFEVGPTTPASWNVRVSAGRAIVDGTTNPWTQGSYIVYSPEDRVIPVQPAHNSLHRYDLVVLHVHDQDNSTEEGYSWDREVITGTAGSGRGPNPPPNSLVIAGLAISGGSSAVTNQSFWGSEGGYHFRHPAGPLLYEYQMPLLAQTSGGGQVGGNLAEHFFWEGGPFSHLMGWPFPTVRELVIWGSHTTNAGGVVEYALDLYWDQGSRNNAWSGSIASLGYNPNNFMLHFLVPYNAYQRPGFRLRFFSYASYFAFSGYALMRQYPRPTSGFYRWDPL